MKYRENKGDMEEIVGLWWFSALIVFTAGIALLFVFCFGVFWA
jgi:hypothetical protein